LSDTQRNDQRHQSIIELVSKQGFLTIEALAGHFGVTVQTIRRDVNALAAEGRLSRYRGGAGLASSIENMEYARRQVVHLAAKQRIAARAAEDVPQSASMFINIGTTTEQAARALIGHRDLQVITNNLNVAHILSANPNCSIVMAGGKVRNRDGAVTGAPTLRMLEQYRADIGIIGVSGIDHEGGLFDFDLDEVLCTQSIIRNSRRVFLLADHSKFGRAAMVKVGNIRDVFAFYTDAPPPEGISAILREAGVELAIAR
jgi:DeoR family glycerol-3-phosphate regulon repressor